MLGNTVLYEEALEVIVTLYESSGQVSGAASAGKVRSPFRPSTPPSALTRTHKRSRFLLPQVQEWLELACNKMHLAKYCFRVVTLMCGEPLVHTSTKRGGEVCSSLLFFVFSLLFLCLCR